MSTAGESFAAIARRLVGEQRRRCEAYHAWTAAFRSCLGGDVTAIERFDAVSSETLALLNGVTEALRRRQQVLREALPQFVAAGPCTSDAASLAAVVIERRPWERQWRLQLRDAATLATVPAPEPLIDWIERVQGAERQRFEAVLTQQRVLASHLSVAHTVHDCDCPLALPCAGRPDVAFSSRSSAASRWLDESDGESEGDALAPPTSHHHDCCAADQHMGTDPTTDNGCVEAREALSEWSEKLSQSTTVVAALVEELQSILSEIVVATAPP